MPQVKEKLPKNRILAEEKGWIFLYLQSHPPAINQFAERILSYCDEWAVMNFTPAGSTVHLRGTAVWVRGFEQLPEDLLQMAIQTSYFRKFAIAVLEQIPVGTA